MNIRKFIQINNLRVTKGCILSCRLSYSSQMRKYFSSDFVFAKYDANIESVSKSILAIPVVSSLIALAWATGADLFVDQLDKNFSESLQKVKTVMKNWHSYFSFSTNINVEKVITNRFQNARNYGLLFSGGVDSTASYIRNKHRKPQLIMVWGQDIPLSERHHWKRVRSAYEAFARQENVKMHFIETNVRSFLNEGLLDAEFARFTISNSWWEDISHGITLIGLCAPLTIAEMISTILIASTFSISSALTDFPHGSHPLIDNKLSWANVAVFHEGYELSRQDKMRVIKNFAITEQKYPLLRVCLSQFRDFNCGECEKCSRTIAGLILENLDPRKFGFRIGKDHLALIKRSINNKKLKMSPTAAFLWEDIQRHIPERGGNTIHNSDKFFDWLKDFDISSCKRKRGLRTTAFLILKNSYGRLPRRVRNMNRMQYTYEELLSHFCKFVKI